MWCVAASLHMLTMGSDVSGPVTEVFMEVSFRRLAIVQHRHPPARGLLSLASLLSAFLLTGIKRSQVADAGELSPACW